MRLDRQVSCELHRSILVAFWTLAWLTDNGLAEEAVSSMWNSEVTLPAGADLSELEGVEFRVIKKWDFENDGYRFLHGVALAWHESKLFASFGHNKGSENTVSEEAHYRVSNDGGKTWGPLKVIDSGDEDDLAVSHGAFLSNNGDLWAFMGAYYGKMKRVHTRAYTFNHEKESWDTHGTIVDNGFWAMNEPVQMSDGNWIMPGLCVGYGDVAGINPPAVAISDGDDFTKWQFIPIPVDPTLGKVWGECSLMVLGKSITCITRYGKEAIALTSSSQDNGRTWTTLAPSNLPMTTSKPTSGILSNGQRYLICTTTADTGNRRDPLTIALSRPGEETLSRIFVIRRDLNPGHPGESAPRAKLSYPYAMEHAGKLYVGFSNNGGNIGRTGEGSELWNNNSAEMAVIPIGALRLQE